MTFVQLNNNTIDIVSVQYSVFRLITPVLLIPTAGFVVKHTWLLCIIPSVCSCVLLISAQDIVMRVSLVFRCYLSVGMFVIVYFIERTNRVNYRDGFQHRSLKRDRQMLERVAQVRGAEVQEQAESNAAHEVTGCFNTLLAAALEMQGFLDKQAATVSRQKNREKKNNKKPHEQRSLSHSSIDDKSRDDTEERDSTTIEPFLRSMPDAKLQRCFEMLTKAQDDFIFLQKTRGNENRHLEINPFLVRIMLENSARIIKYGNRRMVIKIKAEQRLCFDSSVAYLRQILHQLMRALSNSDMLELEGAVVSRDGVLLSKKRGEMTQKKEKKQKKGPITPPTILICCVLVSNVRFIWTLKPCKNVVPTWLLLGWVEPLVFMVVCWILSGELERWVVEL